MKVSDIELPNYTRKQEIWNSATHAVGDLVPLIGGPFLLIKAVQSGNVLSIVSSVVFLLSLLMLYTVSATYHGMTACKGKKVMRVIDHDMVFVLIMGTYTPYCLVGILGTSAAWAYTIWGLCWVLGILGIVLNSCNLKKFAIFSMIDYLAMGWLICISMYPLIQSIGWYPGTLLLLLGGIAYSVGAGLYALGKKHSPWFHTVFHVLCLVGTISMFISIYFYVV